MCPLLLCFHSSVIVGALHRRSLYAPYLAIPLLCFHSSKIEASHNLLLDICAPYWSIVKELQLFKLQFLYNTPIHLIHFFVLNYDIGFCFVKLMVELFCQFLNFI